MYNFGALMMLCFQHRWLRVRSLRTSCKEIGNCI